MRQRARYRRITQPWARRRLTVALVMVAVVAVAVLAWYALNQV